MKYVLVTGGVISGVGKGVISSSIGALLRASGLRVTAIKIDPYLNIDAGTFSPLEHGEVFVLDDGGEVDLDLGNYERFMDVDLTRENNITSGKINQTITEKERRGDYLGKTVQVVPHMTNLIQEWIQRVAQIPVRDADGSLHKPDVCVIELGGTVGDIESMAFAEALRQLHFRVKKENFVVVHVSLVLRVTANGEDKTKPTQASVRQLRSVGLLPDLLFCRSQNRLDESIREKLVWSCDVESKNIIYVEDCPSIYFVPRLLQQQDLVGSLSRLLDLGSRLRPRNDANQDRWTDLAEKITRIETQGKTVRIALVGKYTKCKDSYLSVHESLTHAAWLCRRKLIVEYIDATELEEEFKKAEPAKYHAAWKRYSESDGVIVPGGFGTRGIEGKIAAISEARKRRKPFLGICLGYQCAVIEFARNVLQLEGANSFEINPQSPHPVIIEMPEHNTGFYGGTMRLGKRTTVMSRDNSIIRKLYGDADTVEERHRHRYEVNPAYIDQLDKAGMRFVGRDDTGKRMEIMELDKFFLDGTTVSHPYFVGVQFHPEYLSRPLKPSPPYVGLLLAASGKLDDFLKQSPEMRTVSSICEMDSPPLTDDEEAFKMEPIPDNVARMHGGGDAGLN
ncbi:hypothetical protein RvY_04567 [Ramazzottius varieornatus]|uniref:CTP synthase n=1 Tax=Ramazzottius varieornatus TaxID=947166 RepID=A0A1D1USP1_RAMVA|nr:hypothetical protein RvY_04567 [Ramazzottius varieornatus]